MAVLSGRWLSCTVYFLSLLVVFCFGGGGWGSVVGIWDDGGVSR